MGAKFWPVAAQGGSASEHVRHVSQAHQYPASGPGVVTGDMVRDLSEVLPRLGSDNKAGHNLGLGNFVQQFGKNPFAIETFAAIELVDP